MNDMEIAMAPMRDDLIAARKRIEVLENALRPFAEPHAMGDNYVQFAPRLIEAARAALKPQRSEDDGQRHAQEG